VVYCDLVLFDRAAERAYLPPIAEGVELTTNALKTRFFGAYCLQAAIAAVHAEAPSAAATNWAQIVGLYDVLLRVELSPVVELNRAVAVAMRDGPAAALTTVERLLADLGSYHLAHAVHADLCRRLGKKSEAAASYRRALALARQEPERRFLQQRLSALTS
jgi:RNA polymerase sigma-70 factor (ECF subfamily)